jgi:predicted RNA-binding protein YlqC (UPF0109 family)
VAAVSEFKIKRETKMKELVNYIATQLVDAPDQVEVTEEEAESAKVLKLKVAKDDLGKVIGKQGRTAKAMRVLLSAVSQDDEKRVSLEIVE